MYKGKLSISECFLYEFWVKIMMETILDEYSSFRVINLLRKIYEKKTSIAIA